MHLYMMIILQIFFRPTIEKGSWITDSKQSDDIPQAVITRNYQGYNVNDIAEFETENGTLKVRIIGVIGDNEKYLGANSEYESNEPYNLHYGLIHVGLPTLVDLTKDKLPSIKEENVPKI